MHQNLTAVSPAAVQRVATGGVVVEDVPVGRKEALLEAEDDDVVRGGGQREEEHLELEAHPQEDATRDQGQDAAEHGVLSVRGWGAEKQALLKCVHTKKLRRGANP